MDYLQLRWSLDDAARIIEAIDTAQEHTVDKEWNQDVQLIKARLLTGLAKAGKRAARNGGG